ncbi:hypothetical protein [Clostridium chromiireducens]|uniref:Uncharacterized protein n=1 Tax=Clostridium chromiireducens TaxID=225345 RepID=A0A1V4IS00_9CLOT|nr:hypothetical protein [Clostridium chromiireducens]OPJ62683.1 hypothetical protein CLCHR_19760 [Clostridium chromiireducens]RII33305.1 hypothetical protein D2A34_16265 [Clostridium chromiireducens]
MSKILKNIVAFILGAVVFVQIYCINIKKNEKNIKVYNTLDNTQKHKALNELYEELSCIEEKDIIAANKRDNVWYLKIKISGNKEELLNDISKLRNYDISDYEISKKEDKCNIVLEISAKESI